MCGKCANQRVIAKGRLNRRKALDHLGGACRICGYKQYECALDVHHLNPKVKDANFASMRGWSWPRLSKELEGCILLCKNCHSALHGGLVKWDHATLAQSS